MSLSRSTERSVASCLVASWMTSRTLPTAFSALPFTCCAVHLGLGITGPLAYLALGAACCVIDGAFNFVAVHVSTSVESRSFGCKKRAHECALFELLEK